METVFVQVQRVPASRGLCRGLSAWWSTDYRFSPMSIEPGRQRTNLLNVVRFTLARPQALAILAGKVVKRVKDRSSSASLADSLEWIDSSAISSAALAQQVDPTLWGEALEFGENLRTRAKKILSEVPFDIGGVEIMSSCTG